MEAFLTHWVELTLGVLGAGNIFFIKRLVSKIDESSKTQALQASDMAVLSTQIESLKEHIGTLTVCLKDLTEIKRDVAVIQYAMGIKQFRPTEFNKES